MNNNIQEDYCSFEVSKLLKEKGFDVGCQYWDFEKVEEMSVRKPTHSLAIKWIRENFGIHIHVKYRLHFKDYIIEDVLIESSSKGGKVPNTRFKSYSEATEAALLYTLQNLIK